MSGISGRYARALFRIAEDSGDEAIDRFGSLLEGFVRAFERDEKVRALFLGPHITEREKRLFLESVYADADAAPVLAFLSLLLEKGRIDIVGNILLDYRRLELDARNIREALVESAFPLDDGTLAEIREAFRKKTGSSEIRATVRVVPELVGGVRVTIDGAVYDGSVRAELNRLRDALKK
jgi:F-type H+-transporting ATPase subunit delta